MKRFSLLFLKQLQKNPAWFRFPLSHAVILHFIHFLCERLLFLAEESAHEIIYEAAVLVLVQHVLRDIHDAASTEQSA